MRVKNKDEETNEFPNNFDVMEKTTIHQMKIKMKPNAMILNASGHLIARTWRVANHWWSRENARFAQFK